MLQLILEGKVLSFLKTFHNQHNGHREIIERVERLKYIFQLNLSFGEIWVYC